MSITIRPAVAGDAPALARVHVACWRQAYAGIIPASYLDSLSVEQRAQQWARQLTTRGTTIRVAVDDAGEVVGFVSAGVDRAHPDEGSGEVYALYLDAAHHGKGIGSRLFFAAVEDLRTLGFGSLVVWVLEANPSRTFYEKVGGTLLEARKDCTFGEVRLAEVAYGWSELPRERRPS